MAARHDLHRRKLPDHWLLEPEPGPSEREVARLKNRVTPFSVERRNELIERYLAGNPGASVIRGYTVHGDVSYERRIKQYHDKIVPEDFAHLHTHLEVAYSQIPFTITLSNSGRVQAENLVVTVNARSGGVHTQFKAYPVFGPNAPTQKDIIVREIGNYRLPRPIPGRHEIHFPFEPNGGCTIEFHCADSPRP
jgi:hypothetical protein